jgi:hypothetical protein
MWVAWRRHLIDTPRQTLEPDAHFSVCSHKVAEEQLNPELQKPVLSRVPRGADKNQVS